MWAISSPVCKGAPLASCWFWSVIRIASSPGSSWPSRPACEELEQFSNSCALFSCVQGGFFLRKKPLIIVLSVYSNWRTAIAQLEYGSPSPEHSNSGGEPWRFHGRGSRPRTGKRMWRKQRRGKARSAVNREQNGGRRPKALYTFRSAEAGPWTAVPAATCAHDDRAFAWDDRSCLIRSFRTPC